MKFNLSFDGENSPCLYSIKNQKFYCYETDQDALVEDGYEVTVQYCSQSGLSGSGKVYGADLILFGHYRTDVGAIQQKRQVVNVTKDGTEVFGYAPFVKHEGINKEYPIVLTDGDLVVYSLKESVTHYLRKWDDIRGTYSERLKNCCYRYWVPGREDFRERPFLLLNEYRYKGVDAVRFVDLRAARAEFSDRTEGVEAVGGSCLSSVIGIYKYADQWVHFDRYGLCDWVSYSNPRDFIGQLVNGWYSDGYDMYWRRCGQHEVHAFVERRRETFLEDADKSLYNDFDLAIYKHEDGYFPVIEFFGGEDEIKKQLLDTIQERVNKDLMWQKEWQEKKTRLQNAKNILAAHPEWEFRSQDFEAAGCSFHNAGSFLAMFSLHQGATGAEFLNHPKLDQIFDIHGSWCTEFVATILYKAAQETA